MLAEKQGESVQVEEPAYMPRHAGQLLCMCDLPAKYPVNVDCVTYALIIEFCELELTNDYRALLLHNDNGNPFL